MAELERLEQVGRLLRQGMRFDAVAETPEALGVMLGDLVTRVRELENENSYLREYVTFPQRWISSRPSTG